MPSRPGIWATMNSRIVTPTAPTTAGAGGVAASLSAGPGAATVSAATYAGNPTHANTLDADQACGQFVFG